MRYCFGDCIMDMSRYELPQVGLSTRAKTFSESYAVEPHQHQAWALSADNPEATAYGARGWEDYSRFTPEANARAWRLFEEAIRRDPHYAALIVDSLGPRGIEETCTDLALASRLDNAPLMPTRRLATCKASRASNLTT